MNRTRSITAALTLTILAGGAAIAFAQPERPMSGTERRLQAQVDRMMNMDQDGNGEISREEMPARLAERMFDAADTDENGSLTREEITAHLSERAGGREGGRPQERPAEGGATERGGEDGSSTHEMFEGSMKVAGQAVRALRRSALTPDTRDSDLDAVQSLQEAMIASKGVAASEQMASQAEAKYGEDTDAYKRDIRQSFVDMLRATLDLEAAILAGDTDAAKTALGTVLAGQKSSHDAFQED
ncbi:MAG: hypothetical protein AB8F26_13425 [Phycisphaerales bacterium]